MTELEREKWATADYLDDEPSQEPSTMGAIIMDGYNGALRDPSFWAAVALFGMWAGLAWGFSPAG